MTDRTVCSQIPMFFLSSHCMGINVVVHSFATETSSGEESAARTFREGLRTILPASGPSYVKVPYRINERDLVRYCLAFALSDRTLRDRADVYSYALRNTFSLSP